MDVPTQTYRISFSTLFLWTLFVLLLLDNTKMLLVENVRLAELQFLRNLSLVTLLSLISSTVLVCALKSEISVEGLTSFNMWGAPRFVSWDQITDARTSNFLGLGYYRITGSDGRRMYVARYLSRQREFELIVAAITKEQNPLRKCIEIHSGAVQSNRG